MYKRKVVKVTNGKKRRAKKRRAKERKEIGDYSEESEKREKKHVDGKM